MKTILQILQEDHQVLQQTMEELNQLNGSPHADYERCFTHFKEQFKRHDEAEEEIFYPELKKYPPLDKLVRKGIEAHHLVKIGILELRLIPFDNERWLAKFAVIRDSILSHMEEEETLLFPKVETALSTELLEAMGNKVLDRRAPKLDLQTS